MNSKLFKPLNEQIQVIKIKRQGIDDAERDLLIESIISENIVESLTEDVELASINEDLASYLKRFSNKAANKKLNRKIGKYYKDAEEQNDAAYKSGVKDLHDNAVSERSKLEQDYYNKEINNREYKKALKRINRGEEKDLRRMKKENYKSTLELAKSNRKNDIASEKEEKKLQKEEEKHQRINKKLGNKSNAIDKEVGKILGKKPEEGASVERPDNHYTTGDFKTEVKPKEEKDPKDNWYLNDKVKPEEDKTPKDNWVIYNLDK